MRREFKSETPELILIVTKSKRKSGLEKAFQKALDRAYSRRFVALEIYASAKNLKKLVKAAKLISVRGIFLGCTKQGSDTLVLKGKQYCAYRTDGDIQKCVKIWTGNGR